MIGREPFDEPNWRFCPFDCSHAALALRPKVWINQGDIILISLREFQDEKADVIQKYSPDEARELKKYGQLPETAKINEGGDQFGEGDEGSDVEFEDASDDEEEEDDEDLDDL